MPSVYVKKYPNGRRQTVTCQHCGAIFTAPNCWVERGHAKFCSRECKSEAQRDAVEKACECCGKVVKVRPSEIRKGWRFCSWECRSIGFRGEGNPAWSNDPDYRGHDWSESRQAALKRDGSTCQDCGATEKLVVHHLEPWSETQDNSLGNLQTLCIGCHKRAHSQRS